MKIIAQVFERLGINPSLASPFHLQTFYSVAVCLLVQRMQILQKRTFARQFAAFRTEVYVLLTLEFSFAKSLT